MHLLTIIWAMSAAASLTLGIIYLVVWLHERREPAQLVFFLTAASVSAISLFELALMTAETAHQFGVLLRWAHVPVFFLATGVVAFVHLYFGSGRLWLGCAAVGLRLAGLIVNFAIPANVNYRAIHSLDHVRFLGEPVSVVGRADPSMWTRMLELSSVLLLIYVVDASVSLWKTGGSESRRRALALGGALSILVLGPTALGILIHSGLLHVPYLLSFPFLGVVVAMGYELTRDAARSSALAAEMAHLTRVGMVNDLAASLAHELSQPLAIVLSNSEAARHLLTKSPPGVDEVRTIVNDIAAETRRAGNIIEHMRAFLRRRETEFQPLDVNEIVGEVLRLTHADLVRKGVTVCFDGAPGLPLVNGDCVQIQQVVLNLLTNAAESMSENANGPRIICVETRRAGGDVRVSVRDEGKGLPAAAERVFQPFFTTKLQGLGVGLAVCRSISEAHGGSLRAESRIGGSGATFHLTLPPARVAEVHA